MTIEEMDLKLKKLISPKRYVHSVNVARTAELLAQKYGADTTHAYVAGLLHDCARDTGSEKTFELCRQHGIEVDGISERQPELLHGPVGAKLARLEFGIEKEDILKAIENHTLGREGMGLMEKIVFTADCIEPGRDFPGVEEIRKAAFTDLDSAMQMALDSVINHVIIKGALIHPETIKTRNYILLSKEK